MNKCFDEESSNEICHAKEVEKKNANVLSQTYTKVSKFDIVMDSMESIEICCFRTKSG